MCCFRRHKPAVSGPGVTSEQIVAVYGERLNEVWEKAKRDWTDRVVDRVVAIMYPSLFRRTLAVIAFLGCLAGIAMFVLAFVLGNWWLLGGWLVCSFSLMLMSKLISGSWVV